MPHSLHRFSSSIRSIASVYSCSSAEWVGGCGRVDVKKSEQESFAASGKCFHVCPQFTSVDWAPFLPLMFQPVALYRPTLPPSFLFPHNLSSSLRVFFAIVLSMYLPWVGLPFDHGWISSESPVVRRSIDPSIERNQSLRISMSHTMSHTMS